MQYINTRNNYNTETRYNMEGSKETILVKDESVVSIYLDPLAKDYDGLSLVANSFADDICLVSGERPNITTKAEELSGNVVIIGSIGNHHLIDTLTKEGKVDVSEIKDKWECYKIQVIEQPAEGIDKAIVVVGSDKRGTIYGVYQISELIGVSPWVYWADVAPVKRNPLVLLDEALNKTSKEPSVKYRGFFMNDEWPSLGSWVMNKFGGFNEEFYEKVFELLLRLKGNYLWPAMWSAMFSENGKSSNIANAKLAHTYGVVMGTSHHEAMFRAGEEWQKMYQTYGASNEWNFATNEEAITKFWEDGLKRNKDFDSVITLGMRGECDSELGGGIKDNIELLKRIIRTQKELLRKYDRLDTPQVLILYKEVEKFWYGTDEVRGLKDWDVLDDVIIMRAEDNFGNLRTLPEPEVRDRTSGYGMYYHFDYHGGPRSYEWVNVMPLEKTWEQMSMAYDYGIRSIWIVNVGDLKPMEFPLTYFLDLAYDFEAFGTKQVNKTKQYTVQWVQKQFGGVVGEEIIQGIAEVLAEYTRMNGKRKPETVTPTTYHIKHYNEAKEVLKKAIALEEKANKYYDLMPEQYKDAYYQLVLYPTVASVNVTKMQIYAAFNGYYFQFNSVLANQYEMLVKEAIRIDMDMQDYYNNTMASGKWQGIMSSAHVGYENWDATGWHYPEVSSITPMTSAYMLVDVEGVEEAYTEGMAALPIFTNLKKESYEIMISNKGDTAFDYKIDTTADWILLEKKNGCVTEGMSIHVSLDWDKIEKDTLGSLTITGANQVVTIKVEAKVFDVSHLPKMTFVSTENVVSIEAEHTSCLVSNSKASWAVIKNYGRTLSSMKLYPTTNSFVSIDEAPYLEYTIYLEEAGEYVLTMYFAPTNPLIRGTSLRYAVMFDEEDTIIKNSLSENFVAGDCNNENWSRGVMDNIHIMTTTHQLTAGLHTLRFYALDAGLVLQKLVVSKGELIQSYFGPKESYYRE